MENKKFRACYHNLTMATSEDYSLKERLLCLKECFETLAEEDILNQKEVSEIILKVHSILTPHFDDSLK